MATAFIRTIGKVMLRRIDSSLVSGRSRFGIDYWRDIARLTSGASVDVVFDVGANRGQNVKDIVDILRPHAVHCFEPVPSTYARLLANTRRFPNVVASRVALGDAPGSVAMDVYENDRINSLVQKEWGLSEALTGTRIDQVTVQVSTVDRYCIELGIRKIDVLKIDTEGYDLNVLRGAANILAEGGVRFVVCEFVSLQPQARGRPGNLLNLIEYLEPYGFVVAGLYTEWILPTPPLRGVWNALFLRERLPA